MFFFRSRSQRALLARVNKLGTETPSCPKRRLTIQALVLSVAILVSPLVNPTGSFASTDYADSSEILAIDSPDYVLDTLAMTEDGFLLKTAGQSNKADNSNLADIIEYRVEAGDSLSTIARRFGVSTDTIVWENDIANPHSLKVGSMLRILPVSGITHLVQTGDTIEKIAKKYGLTTERLAKQNQVEESGTLVANTKLVIPGGKRTISTSGTLLASAKRGSYAAYRAPSAVDGAVIVQNSAPGKTGKWMIKPTSGIYTTYFGSRRGHWAIDIADRSMPDIVAAAAGTVVDSACGWNGGYGCMVVIDHGDGYKTLYGHLKRIDVAVGDAVDQGQKIGQMGATGRVYGSTGIHLHFEVIENGKKKNPLAFY